MSDEESRVAVVVTVMACLLLIAVLVTVVLIAKYMALISETYVACETIRASDSAEWIDLCREVGY
jgi:hypothetical protein